MQTTQKYFPKDFRHFWSLSGLRVKMLPLARTPDPNLCTLPVWCVKTFRINWLRAIFLLASLRFVGLVSTVAATKIETIRSYSCISKATQAIFGRCTAKSSSQHSCGGNGVFSRLPTPSVRVADDKKCHWLGEFSFSFLSVTCACVHCMLHPLMRTTCDSSDVAQTFPCTTQPTSIGIVYGFIRSYRLPFRGNVFFTFPNWSKINKFLSCIHMRGGEQNPQTWMLASWHIVRCTAMWYTLVLPCLSDSQKQKYRTTSCCHWLHLTTRTQRTGVWLEMVTRSGAPSIGLLMILSCIRFDELRPRMAVKFRCVFFSPNFRYHEFTTSSSIRGHRWHCRHVWGFCVRIIEAIPACAACRFHRWADSISDANFSFFFSYHIFSHFVYTEIWTKLHLLRHREKKAKNRRAQRVTVACAYLLPTRRYWMHTCLRAVNSAISIWLSNGLRLKNCSASALESVAVTSEQRIYAENEWRKKNGANKNFTWLCGTCVFHDDDDGTRNWYVFVVYIFVKTSKSNCMHVGTQNQSAPLAANAKVHVMIAFWRFAFFPSFNSGFGSRCCYCWLLVVAVLGFSLSFFAVFFFDHENLWNCIARHPRENLSIISLALLSLFGALFCPCARSQQ